MMSVKRYLHFRGMRVQELLSHRNVSSTMIYTHVLRLGAREVRSPLDPAQRRLTPPRHDA